jgi:hypothetical protein
LKEERRLRVSENRVLRIIFVAKTDELTGEWGKLHNEELNYFYPSPTIVRVLRSRRMRWAGHVERMWERKGVLVGKPDGKNHLGDAGVDKRILLRWIFRKWDVWVWTGPICLRIGADGGHL